MISTKHVTLLDFDGVLFRNQKAHAHIAHRITKYVDKVLHHGKGIEFSKHINTHLYKTYGHTVIGLREIGYCVDIHEFNSYVYTSLPYDEYKTEMVIPDNTYIFSNAPTTYCNAIASMDLPNIRDVIPSYGNTFLLKPQQGIYCQISQQFNDSKLYFVDDCMINLRPITLSNQWVPILFTKDSIKEKIKIGTITLTSDFEIIT